MKGDLIAVIVVILIALALGWFVIIPSNQAKDRHTKIEGVCEYLHAEYHDELCIKDGVVVYPAKK